jgi:molybdate transport system permease protein
LLQSPGNRAWIFRLAMLSTLAVLGVFFAVLLFSLAGATTPSKFQQVLARDDLWFAIRLSLFTATLSTAMAVVVALPAAYALSQLNFPGKKLIDTLMDLPIVLSPVALGAALLVFFNTWAGRAIEDNVITFVFQRPGLVLAQFTVVVALAVRLLKSAFDMVDPRYSQVSRVMGCSQFQAFLKVTLPLARPGILGAVILTWARAIGEFGASVTLAGATAMKTETLPISIYLSFATADVAKAVAVVFVLVLVSGIALIGVRVLSDRVFAK